MDTIPRTPAEYRSWWQANAPVPYGYCWCGCEEPTSVATRNDTRSWKFSGEPLRWLPNHHKHRNIPEPNPSGYCMCGCGRKTALANRTDLSRGYVKDKPLPYVRYHDGTKTALTESLKDKICSEYTARLNLANTANVCGVASASVRKVLDERGIHVRSYPLDDVKHDVITAYFSGAKVHNIAAVFGINVRTIYHVLQRNGYSAERSVPRLTWSETQAAKIVRQLPLYRAWRLAVFARDGRTCQRCGATSGLHAHHIKPFVEIVAEHLPTSLSDAESCEALWNTDNGIVLCGECHRLAHAGQWLRRGSLPANAFNEYH